MEDKILDFRKKRKTFKVSYPEEIKDLDIAPNPRRKIKFKIVKKKDLS